MSKTAVPVLTPPWALVKHELDMQRQSAPQPPVVTLPSQGPSIKELFAQAEQQKRQNALDYLLGQRTSFPGSSAPPSPTPITSLKGLNGGPAAWGGTVVGMPGNQVQQLPQAVQRTGGLPNSTYFDVGKKIVAYWDEAKWVGKQAGRFLGPIGHIMTAYQIYQWARRYWPSSEFGMPSRVETQYVIGFASLLYKHPGGYWREYPPPGYGPGGEKMW
jgi:hypothetical protein